MDSWILQGGHPVVSVEAGPDGTALTISQQRFRFKPAAEDADARWHVPVMLRAGVGDSVEHRRLLLDGQSATIDFDNKVDWVVLNSGGWGVYRVRYSSELLRHVTADLGRLDALERFGLVSDTWASVVAGRSPLEDYIELIRLFGDEQDANVWRAVAASLSTLDHIVPDDQRPQLQAFVRHLARPALDRLGWQAAGTDDESQRDLRGVLIRLVGVDGADPEVRAKAAELHQAHLHGEIELDKDVAPAIVSVVAAGGGEAEYTAYLERFRHPTTPQEEVRYLYGLTGFRPNGLLRRTLEMVLADEVRAQNAPFLLAGLLSSRHGGPVAWPFLVEHWDDVRGKLPDNAMPGVLEATAALSTPELAAEVREFIESHPVRTADQRIRQVLEKLEINTAFRQTVAPHIGAAVDS